MSNKLTYRVSPNSITVVVDGFVRSLDKTAINFGKVREALKEVPPDHNLIKDLLDISSFIARETFGRVTVSDDQVRFDNVPVHNVLATRILEHLGEGFSIAPLANFMNRLMANPLPGVRDDLFAWIEAGDMPITDDGFLLAYKKVQDDYYSYHSGKRGKVLHALNTVVTMAREEVDDDRRNECSYGLHFCSYGYLGSYYGGSGHVLFVKIDPADVVAIPMDYGRQKGRTWRMEIIGEINKNDLSDALRGKKVITKLGSYEAGKASTALEANSDTNSFGNDQKGNPILEGRIRGLLAHGGVEYTATELGKTHDQITAWAEQIDFKPENLGSLEATAAPKQLDIKGDPQVSEYIQTNGVDYGAAQFIVLTTKEVGGEAVWAKITHSTDESFRKAANHFRAITTNEADAKAKFLLSVAAYEPAKEEAAQSPTKEVKKKVKGLSFTFDSTNYSAAKVLRGVEDNGQRGYSALTGIPRTTLQGWLKQIKAETSV